MTSNPKTVMANICGVLVHVRPEQREMMQQRLLEIPGLEIHAASDVGKLVVTLEADDYQQAADALAQLQTTSGVLSISLVYHQAEELEVTHSENPS